MLINHIEEQQPMEKTHSAIQTILLNQGTIHCYTNISCQFTDIITSLDSLKIHFTSCWGTPVTLDIQEVEVGWLRFKVHHVQS